MSDEKMISERKAVQRERDAFTRGVGWQNRYVDCARREDPRTLNAWSYEAMQDAVRKEYPLPKVERARMVRDPHGMNVSWFVEDGFVRPRLRSAHGQTMVEKITPERVAVWADLLANPTELVDDDA